MRLDLLRFKYLKEHKGHQENRRITNKVIAAETGISIHSLDDYARKTNGIQHPISARSTVALARFFNVHPSYLIVGDTAIKEACEDERECWHWVINEQIREKKNDE